jgi:hypothetical protein
MLLKVLVFYRGCGVFLKVLRGSISVKQRQMHLHVDLHVNDLVNLSTAAHEVLEERGIGALPTLGVTVILYKLNQNSG